MKRTVRPSWLISTCIVASLLVALSLYHGAGSAPVVKELHPGDIVEAQRQKVPRTSPVASAIRRHDLMGLDLSTPFVEQYQAIADRADQGDLDAICSLVRAFDYCRSRDRIRSEADNVLVTAASQPAGGVQEEALIREFLAKQAEIEVAEDFCRNLDETNGTELAFRIYQAAQRGDLGAMLRFALRPPLRGENDVEHAAIASLHRKEATRLLERAAMLGSMDAARALLTTQSQGILVGGNGEIPVEKASDLLFAAAAVVRRFDGPELDEESELAQALSKVRVSAPSPRAASMKATMEQAVMNRMGLDSNAADEHIDIENATCK